MSRSHAALAPPGSAAQAGLSCAIPIPGSPNKPLPCVLRPPGLPPALPPAASSSDAAGGVPGRSPLPLLLVGAAARGVAAPADAVLGSRSRQGRPSRAASNVRRLQRGEGCSGEMRQPWRR